MDSPDYLKKYLTDQVAAADELCQEERWKEAWRTLLKSSKVALELALKSDGSEKERYIEYSDRLREQAEAIRRKRKKSIPRNSDRQKSKTEKKRSNKQIPENSDRKADAVNKLQKLNDDTTVEKIDKKKAKSVSFDDIAGLVDVKKEILASVILPYCDPDGAKKYNISPGGGMLLYGPPGTGKTMIAKAVANEVDAPFISITPAEIIDKHVGEAERRIAELFRKLRTYDRAILFIDEAEGLLASRSTHSTVMKRVVPQFLMELDGFKDKVKGLMVIAATNVPWDLDEAAYRRLPAMIYVPLPDRASRLWILKKLIQDIERAGDIDYELLTDNTDGFSGSDLNQLVKSTSKSCYCRSFDSSKPKLIETQDFLNILKTFSRSVSRKNLDRFTRFQSEFKG